MINYRTARADQLQLENYVLHAN